MYPAQKLALDKIYAAPNQDRQYSFKLVKVHNRPSKRFIEVYHVVKRLPNDTSKFVVFTIGQLNPNFLSLLKQAKHWFRDEWIRFSDDMTQRDYIAKIYNPKGYMFPRNKAYYSFINESSIIIALELDEYTYRKFANPHEYYYLNVYTNLYFATNEYNSLPNKIGIDYIANFVTNNVQIANMQNWLNTRLTSGGNYYCYVDGVYVDQLHLNIPNNSYIEVIYDQSVISKEYYTIDDLRTFNSTLDGKQKYLLFRPNSTNKMLYYDDNEHYIVHPDTIPKKGLLYYNHKDYSCRNVTDKDYSFYSLYVNNTANYVTEITSGSIQEKQIVIYVRNSGIDDELIYSSLKLHEFYSLPVNIQKDLLANSSISFTEFRSETLEASKYFELARANSISDITKELATEALGYNAISYYLAHSTKEATTADVPLLYQEPSTVFEYNSAGVLLGHYSTTGPAYIPHNSSCSYLEFLYGQKPTTTTNDIYPNAASIPIRHPEFRVYSALFSSGLPIQQWQDITNDTSVVTINSNTIEVNEIPGKMVRVVFANTPIIQDFTIVISTDLIMYFPLSITEDRGLGINNYPLDYPYKNIEIYLNGKKLIQNLDYFMKFPYVAIVNKSYIDYSKTQQDIHVRMYGFNSDISKINELESAGFVNHGVLARNNKYDVRNDRNFTAYINGKYYPRSSIIWAEDDTTARIAHPLNGAPYVIKEPFVPIKTLTGLDTVEYFNHNKELNKRISDLFDTIKPEPTIDQTNAIPTPHYLYSITISKIVSDILDGQIPSSVYTNPYNDMDIINLLSSPNYKNLVELDAVKNGYPLSTPLVVIHPHPGNTSINVNIYQMRFINNVVRVLTNNNPSKIVMDGHFTVTV